MPVTHEIYSWSVARAADQIVVASGSIHEKIAKQKNCDAVVATLLRDPNRPSQGLPVVADYPNGLKVGVIQDSSEFFVGERAAYSVTLSVL